MNIYIVKYVYIVMKIVYKNFELYKDEPRNPLETKRCGETIYYIVCYDNVNHKIMNSDVIISHKFMKYINEKIAHRVPNTFNKLYIRLPIMWECQCEYLYEIVNYTSYCIHCNSEYTPCEYVDIRKNDSCNFIDVHYTLDETAEDIMTKIGTGEPSKYNINQFYNYINEEIRIKARNTAIYQAWLYTVNIYNKYTVLNAYYNLLMRNISMLTAGIVQPISN